MIVESQGIGSIEDHQVPEPWSGRIGSAPLLFISSNPSISVKEEYPRWAWPDEWVEDYFQNRFCEGRKHWIIEGKRTLLRNGEYGRSTAFWAAVQQRAMELLGADTQPGIDYALTEMVHCKSKQETGVREALDHCVERYLQPVLGISGVKVLVVLGGLAESVMKRVINLQNGQGLYGPDQFFGKRRMIAFLPHPNAWKKKTFRCCFKAEQVERLRRYLVEG
jgi:hypothetical protein